MAFFLLRRWRALPGENEMLFCAKMAGAFSLNFVWCRGDKLDMVSLCVIDRLLALYFKGFCNRKKNFIGTWLNKIVYKMCILWNFVGFKMEIEDFFKKNDFF